MQGLSLIIPVYNGEAFVDAALASVAAQSRAPDEVVLVDDGSTDGSLARAERWATVLPLQIVRHETNRGLGATRATGIAASHGEVIALLDVDDFLLPDHFAVLMEQFERRGGIVSANTFSWSPGKRVSRVIGTERRRIPAPDEQWPSILDTNFVHPISVFSRADHDRAGGFNPQLRKMEDWDFWIRMLQAGVRVSAPDLPTALYRLHPGSLSANRGNIAVHLDQLPSYLPSLLPAEREVLERSLRRRQARQDLLRGEEEWSAGHRRAAMRHWRSAAKGDRSLRGGLTGANSSVAFQATVNLLTGGALARRRTRRRAGGGFGLLGR